MQQNSLEGNGSKCFDRDKWGKSSQSFFKHEHHVFFYSKLRLLLNYYYFYNRIWHTNSLQNNLIFWIKGLSGQSDPNRFDSLRSYTFWPITQPAGSAHFAVSMKPDFFSSYFCSLLNFDYIVLLTLVALIQLLYETCLCVWLLSYYEPAIEYLATSRALPRLLEVAKGSTKEKVFPYIFIYI